MPRTTPVRILHITAALASAGAGMIHLTVAPDHMDSWWVSGAFFYALGAFQWVWALVAGVAARRPVLWAGVAVNAGAALLWGVSRSPIGQPAGPRAGDQLAVGVAGVISTILEVAVVLLVVLALRAPFSRSTRSVGAAAPLGAAALVVAALTVPGVSAASAHDHADHDDSRHDSHHQGERGGHRDEPTPSERDTHREGRQRPDRTSPSDGSRDGGHDGDGHDH